MTLSNSLRFLNKSRILSFRKKDISCGYEFRPEMTSGVAPDGTPFAGRMVGIAGNHVAIVSEGRVPNAVVADRALQFDEVDTLATLRRMQAQAARPSALSRLVPNIDRLPWWPPLTPSLTRGRLSTRSTRGL